MTETAASNIVGDWLPRAAQPAFRHGGMEAVVCLAIISLCNLALPIPPSIHFIAADTMASGVEIAGLVLAITPIIITAVEHHRKIKDHVSVALSPNLHGQKVSEFYMDIHLEMTILYDYVCYVVFDDTISASLQSSVLGDLDWQHLSEESVERVMRKRLSSDGAGLFADILCSTLKVMEKMMGDDKVQVGLSRRHQSSSPYVKLKALRDDVSQDRHPSKFWERVRFSKNEQHRSRIISKIRGNNKKLERLLTARSHLPPGWAPTDLSGSDLLRGDFRRCMQTLHMVISKHIERSQGHLHNEAMISLQRCLTSSQESPSNGGSRHEVYDFIVAVKPTSPEPSWFESHVTIERESIRNVHFEAQSTSTSSSATIVSSSNQINDLYEAVRKARANNCNLEMLLNGESLLQLRPNVKHLHVDQNCGISLPNLVFEAVHKPSLKRRRILATILADRLLHYCESPWLRKGWNTEAIQFFGSPNDAQLLERPFLSAKFGDDVNITNDDMNALHPNPSILSFGILLLEIHLCARIDTLRNPDELSEGGEPNINTDFVTASRLLVEITDEIYENYRSAIAACIYPDYLGVTVDLQNEDFRKAFYSHVVSPLKTELFDGFRVKIDDIQPPPSSAGNFTQASRPVSFQNSGGIRVA